MKLTKLQAIDETIKVWEERAESGSDKSKLCYLCVYDVGLHSNCKDCPWHKYMGHCVAGQDSLYAKWDRARKPHTRIIQATRCLEILYAIRELEVE